MNIEIRPEKVHLVLIDNIRLFGVVDKPYQPPTYTLGLFEFPNDWLHSHTKEELIALIEKRICNALWHLFNNVLRTESPDIIKVHPEREQK